MVKRKRGRARRSCHKLPYPNVWVVLSVVVLVVGLSVLTALGPSSSVTGNTIQKIGRLNKGDPFHLAVRDVPGLEKVFTNAAETIQYGQIDVEADDSIPFDRQYVSKFTVKSENKFGPLQFTFKIKEQDLLDKGISRGDLRLYQDLQEYALQLLKVDHGYLYYVVTAPGMGSFVLGRAAAVEEQPSKEEIVKVPVKEEIAEAPGQEQLLEAGEEVHEEVVSEEVPKEPSLVGNAAENSASEDSAPDREKKGFFTKIAEFFRKLFS